MGTIRGVTLLLSFLRSGLRRLVSLNVLAALSLLLGFGLGGLWVRSMRARVWLAYSRSSGQVVDICTNPGGLEFVLYTPGLKLPAEPIGWYYAQFGMPGELDFMEWFSSFKFGVEHNRISPSGGGRYDRVYAQIPLWFPMVLTLVLPLCWVRRWRKLRVAARRGRLGLCLQCGYDTRATPDPNGPRLPQCPECGRPSPSQAGGDPSSVNGDQRT